MRDHLLQATPPPDEPEPPPFKSPRSGFYDHQAEDYDDDNVLFLTLGGVCDDSGRHFGGNLMSVVTFSINSGNIAFTEKDSPKKKALRMGWNGDACTMP